jgi:hypothetical protein
VEVSSLPEGEAAKRQKPLLGTAPPSAACFPGACRGKKALQSEIERWGEMALVQDFSAAVIDYAERLSNMADAAERKPRRRDELKSAARWVLLPAVGAGVYVLARSEYLSRRAKGVVDEAKTRAAEIPEDLMTRVHETTASARSGSNGRRRRSSAARSSGKRAASTSRSARSSSARKTRAR